jgi:hypothetical protein
MNINTKWLPEEVGKHLNRKDNFLSFWIDDGGDIFESHWEVGE